MEEYLKNRIAELRAADAVSCANKLDRERPAWERDIYREHSHTLTYARQELEAALKYLESQKEKS